VFVVIVAGDEVLTEYDMERIMEQLETRCYDSLQEAMKTTEGIGIEYDEDVVCDICRSVCSLAVSFDHIAIQARDKLWKLSSVVVYCLCLGSTLVQFVM